MEFKWDMKEKDWKRMIDEHINHVDHWNNVYGQLYVGKLCLDFYHTKDESDWYLDAYTFELGKDGGYGETIEGHIPYDLLSASIEIPIGCKTFESFKEECEKRVREMIEKKGLEEQANAPLGDWK